MQPLGDKEISQGASEYVRLHVCHMLQLWDQLKIVDGLLVRQYWDPAGCTKTNST